METLSQLPGVHVQPFYFFGPEHQLTKCHLVVAAAQGWAVATELPDAQGPGLMYSLTTLASKVCTEYAIDPAQLSLFARYAYPDEVTNLYLVQFGFADWHLFEGLIFEAPCRQQLPPDVAGQLLKRLASGQALAPEWRAVPSLVGRGAPN